MLVSSMFKSRCCMKLHNFHMACPDDIILTYTIRSRQEKEPDQDGPTLIAALLQKTLSMESQVGRSNMFCSTSSSSSRLVS